MIMNSEIVYLFLYDLGVHFTEEELNGLLKNPEDFSKHEFDKPSPEEISTFNVPAIFNLNNVTLATEAMKHLFKVQVALYTFGGMSIRVRYQLNDASYSHLYRVTFDKKITEFVNDVVLKARKKVESDLSKVAKIQPSATRETYRFYYIEYEKEKISASQKKQIAGLLIDEEEPDQLDDGYVASVLSNTIAYDKTNLFYVGWESAIMFDKEYAHEYELLMAEIANLQLLEMRIYHELLSERIDNSGKVLERVSKQRIISRLGSNEPKALNSELGTLYDNTMAVINKVSDTVFGTGEWYLSRVYSLFERVLKLEEIKGSLEKDLDVINDERAFVADLINFDYDVLLEYVVILLIVIELVIGVVQLFR